MTDDEIRAALARAEAATPGPWHRRGIDGSRVVSGAPEASVTVAISAGATINGEDGDADAAFIAHARTDVPALAAEVLRLREALRTIAGRSGCDCYYAPCDHDTARAALGEP